MLGAGISRQEGEFVANWNRESEPTPPELRPGGTPSKRGVTMLPDILPEVMPLVTADELKDAYDLINRVWWETSTKENAESDLARMDREALDHATTVLHRLHLWAAFPDQHPEAYSRRPYVEEEDV